MPIYDSFRQVSETVSRVVVREDMSDAPVLALMYWCPRAAEGEDYTANLRTLALRHIPLVDPVPVGELCPLVAFRILQHNAGVGPMDETHENYIARAASAPEAIAEVGVLTPWWKPHRGPFTAAADYFFACEKRLAALVDEREHMQFLVINGWVSTVEPQL